MLVLSLCLIDIINMDKNKIADRFIKNNRCTVNYSKKKPSNVAVHECAHAVVAHNMYVKVKEVVIKSEIEGYCERGKGECVIRETLIAMAGHEAEILWFGNNVQMVPKEDWDYIHSIGVSDNGCNVLRSEIIKFLKRNKKTIFHLARELDKRKKLTRRVFLREWRNSA